MTATETALNKYRSSFNGKYEGVSFIQLRLQRIDDLFESIDEVRGEGGRYGHLCPFVQADVKSRLDTIGELFAEIEDQLADWDNT